MNDGERTPAEKQAAGVNDFSPDYRGKSSAADVGLGCTCIIVDDYQVYSEYY